MLRGIGVAIVMLTVAATYGCAQQSRAAVVVEDKTYALTPATVTVKAGVVTGAMTEMKVTERIETGSGRIVTPAKLPGSLKLKDTRLELTYIQSPYKAEAVTFAVTIAEPK